MWIRYSNFISECYLGSALYVVSRLLEKNISLLIIFCQLHLIMSLQKEENHPGSFEVLFLLSLYVSSSVDLQIMLNEFFNDKYTSLVFMSISLSRFHVLTTALLGFVVFSRFSSILSMDTRGALSVKWWSYINIQLSLSLCVDLPTDDDDIMLRKMND